MAEPRISGFHAAAADRAEGRVDLQARFVPHPHATFLIRCASDALASRAILPGDLCVVDRSLEPKHGDVVIATTAEDVVVRVLELSPGRAPVLVADPPRSLSEIRPSILAGAPWRMRSTLASSAPGAGPAPSGGSPP